MHNGVPKGEERERGRNIIQNNNVQTFLNLKRKMDILHPENQIDFK